MVTLTRGFPENKCFATTFCGSVEKKTLAVIFQHIRAKCYNESSETVIYDEKRFSTCYSL